MWFLSLHCRVIIIKHGRKKQLKRRVWMFHASVGICIIYSIIWKGRADMEVTINNIDKVRKFVDIVSRFDCDIDLVSGHTMVDAKSILGIFSLNIMKPMTMIIHDNAENAEVIKNSLKEYVA